MKKAKSVLLITLLLLLVSLNFHVRKPVESHVNYSTYPYLLVRGATNIIDSLITLNDSSVEICPSSFNVSLVPPGTGVDSQGNLYTVYADGKYYMVTRNIYAGSNTIFHFEWYDWKCTIAPIFENDGYHIYNSCTVNIELQSSPVNVANISAVIWSIGRVCLPISVSFQYVLHQHFKVNVPGYSVKYLIILFMTDIPKIRMFSYSSSFERWLNSKNATLLLDVPLIPDVVIEAALGYTSDRLVEAASTDDGMLFILSRKACKRFIWVSYPIDIPLSDVPISQFVNLNDTLHHISKLSRSETIYMGILFLSALTSAIKYTSVTYTVPYYIDALCIAEASLEIFNLTAHVKAIRYPLKVQDHIMKCEYPYQTIQHEIILNPLPGFTIEVTLEITYPKRWFFKHIQGATIIWLLETEYNSSFNKLHLKLKPIRGAALIKTIFEAENAISHLEILNSRNRRQSVFSLEQQFKVSITLTEWVVNGFINVSLLDSSWLPLNMTTKPFNGSRTVFIYMKPVEGTYWISVSWFNSTDSGFKVKRLAVISYSELLSSIQVLNMLHQSIIFLHIDCLDGLLAKVFVGKRLLTTLSVASQLQMSIPHRELHGESRVTIEFLVPGDEEGLTVSLPIAYLCAEYLNAQGKLVLYSSVPMNFSQLRVLIVTCKGNFITLTPMENGTLPLSDVEGIHVICIYGGSTNLLVKSLIFSP